MSQLPGFHKIGGATKFSDLEMDKTFDESMKLLNQHSTEYEWFFTKLHNEWDSSIEETTIHSSFDFDTHLVRKEWAIPRMVTYPQIKLSSQYQVEDNSVNISSSFGELMASKGGYIPGTIHSNTFPTGIDLSALSSTGGITSYYKYDEKLVSAVYCAGSQYINNKQVLTEGSNQRRIFLEEDSSRGTLKHYILDNTEFIEYSEISTIPNTLQIDYFPENLGEYLLGKDTIFLVPSDDVPMEYTLTTIKGNCFIREIPSTVTSIQNYNPRIENFVLDISDLNITEIDQYSFSGTMGTVLVNYNTYNLLVSNNRIDGEETGSDHPILDNDRTIIRVVA